MGLNKHDFGRDGKLKKSGLEKYIPERLEDIFRRMDKEERLKNPPKPKPGIRSIVLDAYKKGGKEAAYKAAEMANERIGSIAYTTQTVDEWIEEIDKDLEI